MSRPVRILTFLHSFEPGGVERVAFRLVASWQRSGIDAPLIMGRGSGAMRSETPLPDYQLLAEGGFLTSSFETFWMIARLRGVIRRVRPDVLFCAGNTYMIVAVALRLLLGRRCPPIVAKVSNDLARKDLSPVARFAYHVWLRLQGAAIDQFVGMAPQARAEIAIAMQIADNRVTIIDDPALSEGDIERFAAAPRRAPSIDRRRFLAVGRLVSQKNFALAIAAFADIARPGDKLTILGEGPERRALERLAAALGVSEQIELPGHVHPLEDWLADADALILSSDYEGVPAVVIEALAAGLPVAATDCSVSMAGLLGQGRYGLLVPPCDRAALALAIENVAKVAFDPAEARNQSQRFTIERAAGAYLDVLESCVAPVPEESLHQSETGRSAGI